jgi:hypothetical protein
MDHIAHQPGPVCLEGGVSRWLVGVVGLGVELLHPRPHTRRVRGALLQFEWLSKTRGAQAFARCPGLRALRAKQTWPGWLSYAYWSREGQGEQSRCLSQPTGPVKMCKKKGARLSCARGQVVIARPPVLTPPWRYRRSLVSKGRFAIPINVIWVGICSSLPKRRYRVVIDYVGGDLLAPPPRQGRVLVVSWVMTRVRI